MLNCFPNNIETLVSDTAAYIVNKLMNELPSCIKTSYCTNSFCSEPVMELKSSKLSLNVYNGHINIENDLKD